jgi:hypothetical protein
MDRATKLARIESIRAGASKEMMTRNTLKRLALAATIVTIPAAGFAGAFCEPPPTDWKLAALCDPVIVKELKKDGFEYCSSRDAQGNWHHDVVKSELCEK